MTQLRILWLGLSFPPAVGGASRYAQIMATTIDKERLAEKALFLVGKYPKQKKRMALENKISEVDRIFTYRAGRSSKGPYSYILYILDNLKLVKVWLIAKRRNIDVIVVHGWYMLYPSTLWAILPLLKLLQIKIVIDVRDCYIGEHRLHRLDVFDMVICCGRNVEELVCRRPQLCGKAVYIPVPLGEAFQKRPSNTNILDRYGLKPGEYIFSPTGIDDAKRFPLLHKAWLELRSRGECLDLVVAGRPRDWRSEYGESTVFASNRLILIGDVSQETLASLYSFSAISVNVSNNESFGRVPIEALNLGVPMVLPSNVPEFSQVPNICISKDDPISVAEQILFIMHRRTLIDNFDISAHCANRICKDTITHIENMLRIPK